MLLIDGVESGRTPYTIAGELAVPFDVLQEATRAEFSRELIEQLVRQFPRKTGLTLTKRINNRVIQKI